MESGAEMKVKWQTNGQTAGEAARQSKSRVTSAPARAFPSPEIMPEVAQLQIHGSPHGLRHTEFGKVFTPASRT